MTANAGPPERLITTVRLGDGRRPPVRLPILQLRVVEGPDRGLSVAIGEGPVRVGKGVDSQLLLSDAAVSRTHFVVERQPDGLVLLDQRSTNGTFVNGARTREAFLVPGCRVQAGATTFLVELIQAELPVLDHPDAEFHGLIGRSRAMSELFAYLRTLSPTTLAAVICGETGSGKELVARALHTAGPRSKGPFVVFDCGAVDPSLTSATLFGHAAGAFTGAVGTRKGAFVSAHQGTLFLDEIGELPLELQPRLLRALERREVQPLGSDSWVPADVRVVCATHRDLESMVKAGKFRQDLLYRLAGITLVIPPLRERRDDIALLAGHFLRQSRPELTLEPEALEALGRHDWPGNVRELRNVIERAAALATGPALGASDIVLTPIRPGGEPAPPAVAVTPDASLERVELEAIRRALRESRGNKSEAARVLGIARKTLREKMKRYGLSDGESD